jgi:two-component system, chemotaxis family, sensor kinase CheA
MLRNGTHRMPSSQGSLEKLLNEIAAQLPLLEKSDLAPLSRIMAALQSIPERYALQTAFSTLIDRTVALIQNIILSETDFTAGCKKLGESIAKMMKEAKKGVKEKKVVSDQLKVDSKEKTPSKSMKTGIKLVDNAYAGNSEPETGNDNCIPDDLKDLVAKFASNQQAVLEDFEAYILEYEKGIPQAKGAIKRILHTWKGEFGVLDMGEYSGLIHELEDRLENGAVSGEQLFKLKDFLALRMPRFAAGENPAIIEADKTLLGLNKSPQAVPAVENKEQPDKAAGPATGSTMAQAATQAANPESRPFQGDPSLINDFIQESRDHLHTAETCLLELETDPNKSERIDSVFRAWHTIKGVAGFLMLKEIQELAHAMESVMDKARKHEMQLHAHCIDVLLEANDCLKTFLANVEEAMSSAVLKIPANFGLLSERLRNPESSCVKGPVSAASGEKKIGEILVESGAAPAEAVEAALSKQREGDQRKIGEILIEEQQLSARTVGNALAAQTAARTGTAIEETIRVPVNRIGQLVDTIGEAVIAQSMIYAQQAIRNLTDQSIHTKIAHASMIMRQIQEMAMSLRMVSVKATFQKMARLARDLSKKFDRDLDFITEGEDTELDKSVVENIGDPLIHMIRNSIDHGIENADERKKAGKPAKAKVMLRAYHRAGNIYIEVSDDGKGLDRDAILEKAIGKGLCKPDARLTDDEIFRFIFLPGFSTAKVVTDVSGRGVGMDVVRRNIEALRGSVEIASAKGKGTTFTIRLPLTLAIVDGMIVRAGAENYIIPTLTIIESLRPSADQVDTVMQKGALVKVRGELIPLIHLASLFSKNGNGNTQVDYLQGVVMIVEDMLGKKIGLHLDEIVGQQQVVIKSLGDGVGEVPGVTGGAIMSDGNVSLILDVGGIVKLAQG